MKFYADVDCIDELYSGGLSLIVDDRLVEGELPKVDAKLFGVRIDDISVKIERLDVRERSAPVEVVELDEPPSTVMAIVVHSASEVEHRRSSAFDFAKLNDGEASSEFVSWCTDYAKTSLATRARQQCVPVVYCESEKLQAARFLEICLDATTRNVSALLDYSSQISRELHLIRDEAEQLHRATSELTEALYSVGTKLPSCVYHVPASRQPLYEIMAGRQTILQPLGVATRGFCGIDIHFHGAASAPDDEVVISIMALETGEVVAHWKVQARMLARGWNRFFLQTSLRGHNFSATLKIEAAGENLAAFSSGVNSIFVSPAFYSGQELPHSLAFKVWNGLPNATNLRRLLKPEILEFKLKMSEYFPSVRPVNIEPYPGFDVVLKNEEDIFLIHPLSGKIVFASIKSTDLSAIDFVGLAVDVEAAHPDSPIMEAAIWVGNASDLSAFIQLNAEDMYRTVNNWVTLSPLEKVTLEVKGNFGEEDVFVFLAKLRDLQGSQAFAWCHWSTVRLAVNQGGKLYLGSSSSSPLVDATA